MRRFVYSVEIFSPENRASTVLPIELGDADRAERVAQAYRNTTHLAARVVQRGTWEEV